ncbi:LysM peptidoglycan-binding domain-containing protein [Facklamia miroungae]|uniref:LysM peptidoglycan-binding domain-containing protein n=1 Tax=Facklamia miroungae TaxID=120956 RepID=UPI001443BAD8|nr:LysM peptidoglycan-binding domain-containing protein [Facklamia miroungae]NKZ29675.1 LysM peptidoglycan-binding domain-containing protein [Facklamia miroungae]
MSNKVLRNSILSLSMSVLAAVSFSHMESVELVFAQETNSSIGTYTVKAGDGVYRIAVNHGMTMEELKQLNGLTSDLIHPGDILKVYLKENTVTENQPVKEEEEPQDPQNDSTPVNDQTEISNQAIQSNNSTTSNTYTVRPGDYLNKIAKQFGVSVAQLKSWNNLTSDLIHPGNILVVSKSGPVNPQPEQPLDTKPSQPDPSSQSNKTKTYTVRPGDYLNKIAKQFGISVAQLKSWNNLTSDLIHPGNILVVSKSAPVNPQPEQPLDTKPSQPDPSSQSNKTKTYTVRPGDYLNKIAIQFGISVTQLKSWNNLTSDLIHPGNVLIVSKSAVATPTPDQSSDSELNKPNQPSQPSVTKTYTVRPGDYLNKIARQFGITLHQLKSWNNLSSNLIHPGDKLLVSKAIPQTSNPEQPTEDDQPAPTFSKETYTVRPGDWLAKIANQFGITVSQLKSWNNLSSNLIHPGNVLVVSKASSVNPTPPIKEPEKLTSANNYIVKSGDSLYSIALHFGVSVNQLKSWNKLNSNVIYVGQRLNLSPDKTVKQTIPVNSRSVFIDAGHGGAEAGASSYGYLEKDLNLNISRQVADKLRQQGYTVFETRKDDSTVALTRRDDLPNELKTDIFVSIHHNAMPKHLRGTASGILTLYHDRSVDVPGYSTLSHHTDEKLTQGKRLAQELQKSLVAATGGASQGTRPQNLHVTRTTDMPAALVELGYMDNPTELKKLTDSVYQAKLVDGLINGINSYFNK